MQVSNEELAAGEMKVNLASSKMPPLTAPKNTGLVGSGRRGGGPLAPNLDPGLDEHVVQPADQACPILGVATLRQVRSEAIRCCECTSRQCVWVRKCPRTGVCRRTHSVRDGEAAGSTCRTLPEAPAEYVPKLRTVQDRSPAQGQFALRFTRQLLCLLSYTGG
jgi:hypothetical protein